MIYVTFLLLFLYPVPNAERITVLVTVSDSILKETPKNVLISRRSWILRFKSRENYVKGDSEPILTFPTSSGPNAINKT
jgi:hypothetical protein